MLRFKTLPDAMSPSDTTIEAFGQSWNIQHIDFGDGPYWYAVDSLQNATVFLPAAEAHSFIQTQKLDLEFAARVVNSAQELMENKIAVERGLLVSSDDVQALLGNITNVDKKQYLQRKSQNAADQRKVFVYKPQAGAALGHTNNNLDTEILWRYV